MDFALLGSGSKGNGLLVRHRGTLLLADCGFTLKESLVRLQRLGVAPTDIDAILVTHEHADHIGGVRALSSRYRIPVWMTAGTWHGQGERIRPAAWLLPDTPLTLGNIDVLPVTVPHDAREACQFVFWGRGSGECLGLLTDLGSITPHVVETYRPCHSLLLESNHDPIMLQQGSYPPSLKRRVAGDWGHLSNEQAAQLLLHLSDSPHLEQVVLSHLSEQNNHPELALACARRAIDPDRVVLSVAPQDCVVEWRPVIPSASASSPRRSAHDEARVVV